MMMWVSLALLAVLLSLMLLLFNRVTLINRDDLINRDKLTVTNSNRCARDKSNPIQYHERDGGSDQSHFA